MALIVAAASLVAVTGGSWAYPPLAILGILLLLTSFGREGVTG